MFNRLYYNSGLLLLVTVLSLLCFEAGCKTTGDKDTYTENIVNFTATVRYIDIEGGFWGLISSEGEKYEPQALDSKYHKDGLKVRAKVRIIKDAVGFRMWGEQIEIIDIEILNEQASQYNQSGNR